MRVIIAGGRDFNDYDVLEEFCNDSFEKLMQEGYLSKDIEQAIRVTEVISGTAKGADILGERFANDFGIKIKRMPADWDTYGKGAGHRRNADMAKYASEKCCHEDYGVLMAFWDGKSKGTEGMINLAQRYGLRVFIKRY